MQLVVTEAPLAPKLIVRRRGSGIVVVGLSGSKETSESGRREKGLGLGKE